jgi:hypothetical protein
MAADAVIHAWDQQSVRSRAADRTIELAEA